MGDNIRTLITRWESTVKSTNAGNLKQEIEKLLQKLGEREDLKINTARKLFQTFVKHLSMENASNLVQIFKYLIAQAPSYIFSYFLPLLFNKTLELEKQVQFFSFFFWDKQ